MARTKIIFLVISCFISQSLQDLDNNEIDLESNPYKEASKDIRNEQLTQTLGGLFQNVLENEGPNLISNIFSKIGNENAGQLLQGLGSVLASQGKNKEKDSDSPNVLDSLGSLMSALQGDGEGQGEGGAALLQGLGSLLGKAGQNGQGNQAASLLQGLGSLLNQGGGRNQDEGGSAALLLQGLGSLLGQGGQGNQAEQGGIDPALIGSMLNLFANQGQEKGATRVKKSKSSKESKNIKKKPKINQDFNINDILTLAGSLLNSGKQKEKNSQDVNFLTFLPSILQTINTFIGPEAVNRAKSHEGHSWMLPPFLEKLHIMFDHFIHSDIGKETIAALGAEKSFKVFQDEKGRFSYKKFGDLMENQSYRRQWIRIVTDKIASFLQYASEPQVYKSYISGGQLIFNSYINSQGFPKAALFDTARPVETISAFFNHVAKKYFEVKIDSKEYVKPAVEYVKDLLKLAEKSGTLTSFGDSKELSNKLTDTVNLEIIEPLARVNRAYRFAKAVPKCERYVLCLVNENNQNEVESLPGLKKVLYKGSSLLAGWFLSAQTGTPFWTLYTDITENTDCQKLYIEECNGFHVEELRVTTEYVHNEL